MADLIPQLNDRLLTTAEILYYFPDYPALLQMYVWQDYDKAPDFPLFRKFLYFWEKELDGRLHSVRLCSAGIILPGHCVSTDLEIRF
ncbi:MAG TPA: Usg family protein [Alphaproteobacteria bacterium]